MDNGFSAAAHWSGGFDEPGLQRWAEEVRGSVRHPHIALGLVFMSPHYFPMAKQVLEILRVHAHIPLLAGCSSPGLIANQKEFEQDDGITLGLYALPGAELELFHFTQEEVEEANGPGYWHLETGIDPTQTNGWLAFIDPFHLDSEMWLRSWNKAYPSLPVFGGLTGGSFAEQRAQLYLNGDVFEEGGVAISVGGDVSLVGVISQGCTPIGETWTLTKVEQNVIREIGNLPAYEVLAEALGKLSPEEQRAARGNLFIGLVINEYLEEFHRGDFLIRNLIGADPHSGSIAIAALPRAGQTVQFQWRNAEAAARDLTELLDRTKRELGGTTVYGACLCSCNGRGRGLFGETDHDAKTIEQRLGPLGMTGFFCNGELGPVGESNFLHGFTASLALFVKKNPPSGG